jgi:SOS response regulatory protein OraA/RecX
MDDKKKAFQVACRILGSCAQLTAQLEGKLKKRGFSEEVIADTLEKCRKFGYLDDDALMERYIEKEFRKGRGPYMIAAKLRMKAGHPVDDLVFAQITKEREMERLEELLEEGVEKKKLYQKGFSVDLLQ